ncbi:hypothetical protein ambt_11735 [Alteromonas naphthalenivorans]|uniref:Uncharacterized protein n=1 Tax=Alteromonas naphthalenivorans TaxID=715451 RepID=F5ZDA6_ALTNA|nr:hypothetical protein ambt_11735 [Alteromonas naphthalenivorans]
MGMIVHYCIGTQVNREGFREPMKSIYNPLSAMVVVFASNSINATKERLPHTT